MQDLRAGRGLRQQDSETGSSLTYLLIGKESNEFIVLRDGQWGWDWQWNQEPEQEESFAFIHFRIKSLF